MVILTVLWCVQLCGGGYCVRVVRLCSHGHCAREGGGVVVLGVDWGVLNVIGSASIM